MNPDSLIQVINSHQAAIDELNTTVQELENVSPAVTTSITPLWLILISVITLALAIYLLKRLMKVEQDMTGLRALLESYDKKMLLLLRQEIASRLKDVSAQQQYHNDRFACQNQQKTGKQQQTKEYVQQNNGKSPTNESRGLEPRQAVATIVRYASIQEDASTGLRIAERVMNDDRSKMFLVEMTEGSSTATYTFNPLVEKSILSDLQTFKIFTEPFTLSGIPIKVVEQRKGKLEKDGKFWIVKEKLQVDFKY